jgi:antitoxin CcdA
MGRLEKVSIELDSEAVQAAAEAGLDLSQVLTQALRRQLPHLHAEERAKAAQEWYQQNKEAIDWYNRFTAEHGLFSDGVRTF